MKLQEYRASWFDGLLWRTREWDMIAENEAQVHACIDKECAPEFRKKVYGGREAYGTDSLEIRVIDPEVTVPHVTRTDR